MPHDVAWTGAEFLSAVYGAPQMSTQIIRALKQVENGLLISEVCLTTYPSAKPGAVPQAAATWLTDTFPGPGQRHRALRL